MKQRIPILTWHECRAAVPLRHARARAVSGVDLSGARAVGSIESDEALRLTLRPQTPRPACMAPDQVRKALRPPWWA